MLTKNLSYYKKFYFKKFVRILCTTKKKSELQEGLEFLRESFFDFFTLVKESPLCVLLIFAIVGYHTHLFILDLDDNTSDTYVNPNTSFWTILDIFLWWWFLHLLSYLCFAGLPVFFLLNALKKDLEEMENRPLNLECKSLVIIPTRKEIFIKNFKWFLTQFFCFVFVMVLLYVGGYYPIICE